jgi:hypothetical protein
MNRDTKISQLKSSDSCNGSSKRMASGNYLVVRIRLPSCLNCINDFFSDLVEGLEITFSCAASRAILDSCLATERSCISNSIPCSNIGSLKRDDDELVDGINGYITTSVVDGRARFDSQRQFSEIRTKECILVECHLLFICKLNNGYCTCLFYEVAIFGSANQFWVFVDGIVISSTISCCCILFVELKFLKIFGRDCYKEK